MRVDLQSALRCATRLAIAITVGGCGAENFVPSTSADYGDRGGPETVLVLDNTPADTQGYLRIGTGLAHSSSQAAALKMCRAIAAHNGGDAVFLPEPKTRRDWDCVVMRAEVPHSGSFHTKKEFVVYEDPDAGSKEVAHLPSGTLIEIQRRQNGWVKVQWEGTIDSWMRGWVHFEN